MKKPKRKDVLNAGLKALLAGAETSALIKIPATFISELAALSKDKQESLGSLSQEQFNELLTQSELATINAALAAAETRKIKGDTEEIRKDTTKIRGDTTEIKKDVNKLIARFDALLSSGIKKDERVFKNLPYSSIGNLFKGREEILEKLRAQVGSGKATAITQSIQGLGGIGKTRLAGIE